MVLSHPHPDHANGLATLVEQLRRRRGVDQRPGDRAARHAWRSWPRRRGATCRSGQPRPLALGGAHHAAARAVRRAGALAVDPTRGENDNSLVVAVGWRGRSLLFAGDLEADGEAALMARAGPRSRPTWSRCRTTARRRRRRAEFVAATAPVAGGHLRRRAQPLGLPQPRRGRPLARRRRARDAHRPRRRRHRHRRQTRPSCRRGEPLA